jgi:transposase
LLVSILGIDLPAAYAALAKTGKEISTFRTAQHICSWGELTPGNNKSANQQKKQSLTAGKNYFKTWLCEIAWAGDTGGNGGVLMGGRGVEACFLSAPVKGFCVVQT